MKRKKKRYVLKDKYTIILFNILVYATIIFLIVWNYKR